jgi:hypothetical protein
MANDTGAGGGTGSGAVNAPTSQHKTVLDTVGEAIDKAAAIAGPIEQIGATMADAAAAAMGQNQKAAPTSGLEIGMAAMEQRMAAAEEILNTFAPILASLPGLSGLFSRLDTIEEIANGAMTLARHAAPIAAAIQAHFGHKLPAAPLPAPVALAMAASTAASLLAGVEAAPLQHAQPYNFAPLAVRPAG